MRHTALIVFFYGFSSLCVNAFAPVPSRSRDIYRFTDEVSRLHLLPPEISSADSLLGTLPSLVLMNDATTVVAENADNTGLLSNQAIIATFVIGLVPFAVATVEFWRRIAVGDSFGTGTDSVVIIGEDDAPLSSRGRRVLGKGALITAYILFGLAAGVLVIVLYAVITSGAPENVAASLPSSSAQ